MKAIITVLFIVFSINLLAFEGVVHGVKVQNGVEEKFDIYIKGDLVTVEGEDGQGKYKIIINRSSEEIFVCIDNPAFGQKGYYHFTAEQLKREKRFSILSSIALEQEKEVGDESCKGYSMLTDQGTVLLYASKSGEADLSGLSKYMDDPVYELIDAFDVKSSIRSIAVQKEDGSYTVSLEEESQSVDQSRFEIPAGYAEYKITLNTK